MGILPRSGWGASLVEDTGPSHLLRSECLYPNGFLRVLPLRSECLYPNGFLQALPLQSECLYPNGFLQVLSLSTRLFLCEPRTLTFGLGARLENIRRVRLLSVVPPVLGLPFFAL